MHASFLDENILKNIGGVDNNSFLKIIDMDVNDEDMNHIQMIHHSSYCDNLYDLYVFECWYDSFLSFGLI